MSEIGVAEAILLGVVQGLTEWLPISSSGHLVLAERYLGVSAPIFFELALHFGTLVVLFVFYRKTIAEILVSLARAFADVRGGSSWREAVWNDPPRRLAALVVIGTIPTALIGLALKDSFIALYESSTFVGFEFLVMGTVLWLTKYAPAGKGSLGWKQAVLVGVAQGVSISPGISRSGATISAASFLGVDRETAVRYSFLLSIPAIVGAIVLNMDAAAFADAAGSLPAYVAGTIAAALVGYATLAFLVALVRRNLFHLFAVYLWIVGGCVVAAWLLA